MSTSRHLNLAIVAVLFSLSIDASASSTPVASWNFNNTLAADQAGVAALTAIDPLGQSGFMTDTVFGSTRNVYRFAGLQAPAEQAGLFVNTTSLLTHGNAYSVDMVFQFEASQSTTWKNIFGVSNRQSDNAFYVEPGNKLQVWTAGNGPTDFTFGEYHRVTLTNNGAGHVTSYLDGVFQFDLTTTTMDFSAYTTENPDRLITFFADNVIAGGQREFSNGRVASILLFDGELTGDQVRDLPGVPLPAALPLMFSGLGLLGLAARRRST